MSEAASPRRRPGVPRFVLPALALVATGLSQTVGTGATAGEEVVRMEEFRVRGDLLEDFGFRVSPVIDFGRSLPFLPSYSPVVDLVLPNTAASKAGIRPGDRILTADGRPTGSTSRALRRWTDIQKKKWAELAGTHREVKWTLEVEHVWERSSRTIILLLPTPAPHWGATVWRAPAGRTPAVVSEAGPLAARAGEILDHGIWMILRESYVKGLKLPLDSTNPMFLCYQWTLWDGNGGHRMFVSQQRGRTDIILEAIARANNDGSDDGPTGRSPDETLAAVTTTLATSAKAYLTGPDCELVLATELGRPGGIPPADAEPGFRAEVDFWLNRVGKTSPLWPLGVLGQSADARR